MSSHNSHCDLNNRPRQSINSETTHHRRQDRAEASHDVIRVIQQRDIVRPLVPRKRIEAFQLSPHFLVDEKT